MSKHKVSKIIAVVIVLALAVIVFVIWNSQKTVIDSFEKCAAAGNPILESYP